MTYGFLTEYNEPEDDTNAFSKTGALTIKSSSGSSGGLAAAFGIRREDSLDSDEFPHDSSCCDSHHHDNSGDSSSDDCLEENHSDPVQQTTDTLKTKSDNQSKVDKKEDEIDKKKAVSKKSKELRLTTDKVSEIEVMKNSVSEWIDSVHDTHPVPENNFEPSPEDTDKDLAIKPEYQPKSKQSKTNPHAGMYQSNISGGHIPEQLPSHQDPNLVLGSDLIEQVANSVKNYDPRPAKEFLQQNTGGDHSVVPVSALNVIKSADQGYSSHLEGNPSSRVHPPPGFVTPVTPVTPVSTFPMIPHQLTTSMGMYQSGGQVVNHTNMSTPNQEGQKEMISSNAVFVEKMVSH